MRRLALNLAVAAVAVIVALCFAEIALRLVVPPTRGYFVLVPGREWTVHTPPGLLPGVPPTAHAQVNQLGIRGRSFGADTSEYRVLVVGGSTTQCAVLDDSLVWTHLLEGALGHASDSRSVWVGNVGRDGATTRDHVLHLKYLLPQYPRIDAVIALVGVNDMISALRQGTSYWPPDSVTAPAGERQQMSHAFIFVPGRIQDAVGGGQRHEPWYKATALWQLARRVKFARDMHRTFRLENEGARLLEEARHRRATAAHWVDTVPPLERPLVEYRRNLNAMVDHARAAHARLIFITQPVLWRPEMPPAIAHLLWFGWIGAERAHAESYYTSGALYRAMTAYNDVLLDVCRVRAVECIDAARALPPDTTTFYDDVHFNAHGSATLARLLETYLRARPPFMGHE